MRRNLRRTHRHAAKLTDLPSHGGEKRFARCEILEGHTPVVEPHGGLVVIRLYQLAHARRLSRKPRGEAHRRVAEARADPAHDSGLSARPSGLGSVSLASDSRGVFSMMIGSS